MIFVAVSALISIPRQLGCIIAVCVIHLKLDYCNSLYYNLPKAQITRLQHIQNSSFLALLLKLLGLSAIEYKFLSLNYKVITAISNLQLSSMFNVLIVLALHLSLLLLAHQHHPL